MTTSPSASASESQQIEALEQAIDRLRQDQNLAQAQVKTLLLNEDPANGISHHEDIFRLQQDKLRMDTEIQFLQVKLRRLKATW